ncbi:MAG: ABC transporter substrate-binding protein [Planctomycetota bacterium]
MFKIPFAGLRRALVIASLPILAALPLTGCDEAPPAAPSGGGGSATPTASAPKPTFVEENGERVYQGEPNPELREDYPISGRVVIREYGGWKRLNPLTQRLPIEQKLINYHLSFSLLTEHPEEIEPMPWLAESMPVIEGDAQVWTIREGARWTDGTPVTADDAVATWACLEKFGAIQQLTQVAYENAGGKRVRGVEKVDARRFRVRHENNGRRAARDFGLFFCIAPAAAMATTTDALDQQRTLMGCGPYILKDDRIVDEEVAFVRKTDWWGDAHAMFKNRYRVQEFVYKVVEDSIQIEEQLAQGLIDIAPFNSIERFVALKGEPWDEKFGKAHYHLSKFSYIGWNCGRAPFDDPRVRRALAHLMPRERINRERYHDLSRSVSGPFFYRSHYYDPDLEAPRFSPTRALALLAEAGWKDSDGDGRLDKGGKPFRFTLLRQNAAADWAVAIIEPFREALKQVGIELVEEALDGPSALWPRAAAHDYDAYMLLWGIDAAAPEAGVYALFHSSQRQGGYNWQDFADAKCDELLETLRDNEGELASTKAARALHARLDELQPMTFLFVNPSCVVWNRRVENVVPHLLGLRPWDFRVAPGK